jgi:rhodanese-related sulfurtransferase
MAQNTLLKAGFDDVYHLAGDMPGWQRDGLAVELASAP